MLQREIKLLSPWRHVITFQDAKVEAVPFPSTNINFYTAGQKLLFLSPEGRGTEEKATLYKLQVHHFRLPFLSYNPQHMHRAHPALTAILGHEELM